MMYAHHAQHTSLHELPFMTSKSILSSQGAEIVQRPQRPAKASFWLHQAP